MRRQQSNYNALQDYEGEDWRWIPSHQMKEEDRFWEDDTTFLFSVDEKMKFQFDVRDESRAL
jgi:hypothetical protein